jgi:hypothetical protein
MSLNPTGRSQIAWSGLFGLNTELEPADLPEGLSPDNQDMQFVPGMSGTRPGMDGTIPSPFGSVGNTFETTYLLPNGNPINLYLTADGVFRYQDVKNAPTDYPTLFTALPNLYASSASAFNREYVAFHDGLMGQDIPRRISQDLTWQRFTQDGPAVTPTVADADPENITITSITPMPSVNITSAVNNDGVVTISTDAPHGLLPGKLALITGNSVFQYNGEIQVDTVPTTTTLTYNTVGTGWAEGTGGQLIPSQVTVKLASPADYIIQGDNLVIEGNSDANYNNSQSATTTAVAGLASRPVCTFYPYTDSNGGAFNWTYPGDGFNEPLPAPIGSYTLKANESLFFNPNGPLAGTNLPGAPSENNPPMIVFGVNAAGHWDSTQTTISSLTFDWTMTVLFNMQFSAAGAYTFQIIHKEGVMLGMGGGIVPVSGPMNNPQPHTVTAKQGLPLVYANNSSTEFAHVSNFNDQFTVNVPAPGVFPVEIDYCQWHHSNPNLVLLQQTPNADAWSSATAYIVGDKVNVGGSNYVCILANVNHTPPNATYWTLLPPFSPLYAGTSTFGTPSTWTIDSVLDNSTFTFEAVYASGIGTGGTAQIGGLISPGTHQVCMSWLLDDDTITRPSPPISWTAAGNKRVKLTDVSIGPPNVKGRVFNFTGSGGDNFFNLIVPAVSAALPPAEATVQVSTSTVLKDNTSTEITFDFADNSLFAGDACDITGNDLFGQVTLGLPGNLVAYSNRIGAIVNTNKIENLLAMGFEGGYKSGTPLVPDGWNVAGNVGGQLISAPNGWGYAWQETGNGAAVKIGLITQPAYEDATDFSQILIEDQPYTVKVYLKAGQLNTRGTVNFDLYSPSMGVLATASMNASSVSLAGGFYDIPFDTETPAKIPADTLLRSYGYNYGVGQTITRDEIMMVYTDEPVNPSTAILFSYAFNGGAFNDTTGQLQTEYPELTRDAKIMRDNFYIGQVNHLVRTKDNGIGEPSTWPVATVSEKTGVMCIRGMDTGEGWIVLANYAGLYMTAGGEPHKVSQEIQTLWNKIDSSLYRHVQVVNDFAGRRIHVPCPLTAYAPTGATFTPASNNKMLVVDYRELNTSAQIESAAPLHISMTGRMLSSDLTRKWSVWNVPVNSAAILELPGQNAQIVFGSGNGAGLAGGFGQVYQENQDQFFDDDYGPIGGLNGESPLSYADWLVSGPKGANGIGTIPAAPAVWRPQAAYYVTYLSPSHEQEQSLQIGSQRKLYEYLEAYVTGVGNLYMLPLINRLGNPTTRPPKPRLMSQYQNWDLEWPLNYKAQRMAMLFYAAPNGVIPPVQQITISPTTLSLSTFNSYTFSFTLSGFPDLNVIWSCSGGSITQGGVYTAPGTANTYTVTVTSVDNPLLSATAIVTVHGGYDGS